MQIARPDGRMVQATGAADGFNVMPPHLPAGLAISSSTFCAFDARRGLSAANTKARRCGKNLGLRVPQHLAIRPLLPNRREETIEQSFASKISHVTRRFGQWRKPGSTGRCQPRSPWAGRLSPSSAPAAARKIDLYLRLSSGLDATTSARSRMPAKPVTEPSLDRGIVFQEARLFPWPDGHVAMWRSNAGKVPGMARLDKEEARRRASGTRPGLSGSRQGLSTSAFGRHWRSSAGVARRLQVQSPWTLLFLDGPFGATSTPSRRRGSRTSCRRSGAEERITLVLVTHDVDEAAYLGGRVVVPCRSAGRTSVKSSVELRPPRTVVLDSGTRCAIAFLEGAHGSTAAFCAWPACRSRP